MKGVFFKKEKMGFSKKKKGKFDDSDFEFHL